MLEVIRNLATEGKTMMIVTHQISFLKNICHRVLVFDEGRIIEDGSPEQVFSNPKNQRTESFLRHLRG
ncbi:MAG: hypothetical protein A3C43_03310 [Candidatus Schekmanbacteria bacterium RIFCSPHIGHO2_02_FULL_38_11]|uniref:Amino acid ABC transporter ATP-binding protein n=1 Tax=Candidatus Schekmanbacteria bacterium RIFCSPLOWO2_12_FULL_38_15 TaxID=1817883 RepID=A0A1F7SN82_9BACT|nr:MAG: hypothetical protein A2043_03075 [Candidatus Schekmanbacteria bacterium GWA2_38_9]OGL50120.1 MAG: hypothetical protein A3H37_07395 [Candidatus Schekmanbacteria bacterium RIFCSPLOWO2_02_FULL_38_14]OGL54305.1 MAG: hypothetical protein A3C43_03310 [Candidatus Schekmanbacteria bacterium RIFCSPHIGHO2_02_FULL_38_11]OGL55231.1 MAG: hypothetical protein A3G31_09690 [Candidatus Schekmanbacteria bacterium RIFCSPLOWO2_12_FULL_38_15]